MERGQEGTTPPGGAGQARPRQGVVWPPQPAPRPLLPPISRILLGIITRRPSAIVSENKGALFLIDRY
jgi:hypothetical protein